jgi:hypothetical protein
MLRYVVLALFVSVSFIVCEKIASADDAKPKGFSAYVKGTTQKESNDANEESQVKQSNVPVKKVKVPHLAEPVDADIAPFIRQCLTPEIAEERKEWLDTHLDGLSAKKRKEAIKSFILHDGTRPYEKPAQSEKVRIPNLPTPVDADIAHLLQDLPPNEAKEREEMLAGYFEGESPESRKSIIKSWEKKYNISPPKQYVFTKGQAKPQMPLPPSNRHRTTTNSPGYDSSTDPSMGIRPGESEDEWYRRTAVQAM